MEAYPCHTARGNSEPGSKDSAVISESRIYSKNNILRSFYHLMVSESRVTIFVWALVTSYLIATNLHPDFFILATLAVSGYLLTLSIYTLNALMDIKADAINSPSRPLASGLVSGEFAKRVVVACAGSAIIMALFINIPTAALYSISLFLGISYSMPRLQAKKRLTGKLVVTACGAVLCSLTGGVAAQDLNATIFFAAVGFALFALVTLLLGDIADMRGDLALKVKSLPTAFGPRRAIAFVIALPVFLSVLGVSLLRFTNFNPIFPILLIGVSLYSSFSITGLLKDYDNPEKCRRVKSKMRIMHFVLQLTFLLGLLQI